MRERSDEALTARVRAIHAHSRGSYGAPRIQAELAERGTPVSRKRVARVMRQAGLAGVSRRKGPRTTRRDAQARPAPDLVEREFHADAPDRLWVADITYVPTLAGFLYLAIVLDVFSRRIVGWAMAGHLRTELVLDALHMAVQQRRPDSVIHHSDRGVQYLSLRYTERLVQMGIAPSVGSVGDSYDNALAESIIGLYKTELICHSRESGNQRGPWRHCEAVELATLEWVHGYNHRRLFESLGSVMSNEKVSMNGACRRCYTERWVRVQCGSA